MFVNKPEPWQQTLKLISQCPICGQDYSNKTIKLFFDRDNTQMIHITCGHCQSYFVAVVMALGRGISTVGMVTDLSFADMERLRSRQPIEIDEVIEAHKNIEKILIIS